MQMSQFIYNLPKENIALFPPKKRGTTKLLVLDRRTEKMEHKRYYNVVDYIKEGDVIVLNETKVEKRRTYFVTMRNGKEKILEVLFLNKENIDNNIDNLWLVLIRGSKYLKEKDIIHAQEDKDIKLEIVKKQQNGVIVKILSNINPEEIFNKIGHTPIPPYMQRKDNKEDYTRYNTVFADKTGSVAAPTASLNLTEEILQNLKDKGVKVAKVELKVGWGTFAPIREENIEDHKIHTEEINVSKESADIINESIQNGKDVWAFGTTVARTLESCTNEKGLIKPYKGATELYIYPGYKWKVVKHLITNFHMPDSSLILLVSSFAGTDLIKRAYQEALSKNYKFLSYGDSMLIL